jgi:ketosteroid isomerase-like protein
LRLGGQRYDPAAVGETRQHAEADTIAFIRRGYDLWNDEDVDGLAREILSDDVFYQNPPDWPGQSTYRGRDEVARFLREEVAAVIELGDIEIERIEVFGEEYLIHMLARTRGQDSRLDIGKVPVFHVAHVRDGRVNRIRSFLDERQAVAAARDEAG